ncbi:malto-oligosyltrehalose trehalohydrolase, partial [Sphingomonas sp. LH128]|uniref:DUF3459 domain-containing protein n=1 Tax=Sphingomonas sp. LH128 TaxID=473781 RepID=UPI00027C9889
YVEQGQPRENGDDTPRGEPSGDLPRTAFVNFLGNHDQVGNRARGERLHHLVTDRHAYRVMTALTLLTPFTPMLFMGDEFLTDAPFQFFVDFEGDLAEAVRKGRAQEFARFSSFGGEVPDPVAPETFMASSIGRPVRADQQEHEAFVRDLLDLRRTHVTPLLARNPQPVAAVRQEGSGIGAQWSFAPGTLRLRAELGGSTTPFEPLPDPILLLADASSPFALSMTVSPE